MQIRRLVPTALVALIVLAGCSSPDSTPAPTSKPSASSAPSPSMSASEIVDALTATQKDWAGDSSADILVIQTQDDRVAILVEGDDTAARVQKLVPSEYAAQTDVVAVTEAPATEDS